MDKIQSSAVPLPDAVADFVSVLKLQRCVPPGIRRRHVQDFLQEMFSSREPSLEHLNEAMRLMHRADEGDESARALVDPVAPDWEFGQDLETEDAEGRCLVCGRGATTKASKGQGSREAAQDSTEAAEAPYAPSTEPGSAPHVLWQALVELSPDGSPVEAGAWRDAALVALARSGRIANPVEAFRDAKRRLKGQRAYEETKNGAILRRV